MMDEISSEDDGSSPAEKVMLCAKPSLGWFVFNDGG